MTDIEKNSKKFGLQDKIGYAFGDLANNLTFVITAVFLLKFYTDVMGVSAGLVGLMMMVGRIIDAFTDITMGQIVDRSSPTAKGKFAPWLRRMCGPIAVATVLLFPVWFKDMSMGFKVFWMFFSYLLWGSVCYTAINIPYGSMASAISDNPKDRASLSTWRTVGATVGIMLVGVLLPMFVFYKNAAGKTILSPEKLSVASVIFAILMVICYLVSYHLTTERVKVNQLTKKFSLKELISGLIHNRPLIGVIVVALLLLLTQLSLTGTGAYIYPNYFGSAGAFSISVLLGTIITFAFTPFAVKLSTLFGKKELSLYSAIVSAVALLILFFLHTKNLAVWFTLYTIGYAGIAFFSLVCWAMITDVIDATELDTHERTDGTIYSIYSFARKLGQAASSGLIGALLSVVGYSAHTAFDEPVVNGIYAITCLIPAIGYILFSVSMAALYPLNKQRVAANAEKLKQIRNDKKGE